ncbi:MAG: ATP-dependent DNA helicase [Anaerolineae bacterium]|nr:ATP-dependent DNA helicase [Anaerolineae bacterium]
MAKDSTPLLESRKRGRGKLFKTEAAPQVTTAQDTPPVAPPPEILLPANPTADAAAILAAELRRPIACPALDAVFATGGAVAGLLGERYRPREGQIRMAALVRESLRTGRHAIIEAGTGIGKSFAYLIPILWSGVPGVVSTSNKALMNQLWDKDIPQLRRIAPRPFKAALLKGRSNYLCALRLENFRRQRWLPGMDQELALVERALQSEFGGDCERMSLPADLVARLTVNNRDCAGHKCHHFTRCFYERAKREAAAADLVVTNHALLCYNALLAENQILPVRPILVVDEAHQLTNYAINALTLLLEHDLFWGFINHKLTREIVAEDGLLEAARESYDAFFRAVAGQRPVNDETETANRWVLQGEIQEGLALWQALKRIQDELGRHAKNQDNTELDTLRNQSAELTATLEALARPEPEDHIRFCDFDMALPGQDPRAYQAQRRPLEAAEALARALFAPWPRIICASATLGVDRNLDWFRRQVGATNTETDVLTATLESPFDYARQMVVYTPWGLEPAYDDEEALYAARLAGEVQRLVETSRGRALVLCTSRRRMAQLYTQLAPALEAHYPCFCQGELPQPEIVARFKAAGNAVIFATRSFWEGIDIPGDALALVILDKIPFQPFQDPVVRRHEQLIRQRGGNPFQELQVGTAILALRQGAGRLIRTETDRGVIALLDSRVLTKRYGSQIIRSLPGGCHTNDFAAVAAFFEQLAN